MKKKKVAGIMALTLAAAMVLGACGKGDTESGGENPQSSPAGQREESSGKEGQGEESQEASGLDLSEKMHISIFSQADDVSYEEFIANPIFAYWSDMFNLELEWQLPPQGSETDQLNMMFGTQDYTDVIDISYNTENLTTLCEDGVIYNLAPYLDTELPNYKAFLDANPDVKSALLDDEGNLYHFAVIQEAPKQWGGLVYRRDILETMTGGDIQFPSGNDAPATVEDWDYMLPLMKQYFESAGMAEYACLIIPAVGYFSTGELMSGFGIGGWQYVEDGNVKYGLSQDAFYHYLTKMKEWYAAGYIYSDFASRTDDLFFLPNTALTYGLAAGTWYGITDQVMDTMSLPDYGMFVNVQPLASPADTANGVQKPLGVYLDSGRASNNSGWAISTACDEEKLHRLLAAFDYLFSQEGSNTRTMGLSAEQGAADVASYTEKGVTNGTRENGTKTWTEEMDNCGDYGVFAFSANRMPGVVVEYETRTCDLKDGVDKAVIADEAWTAYGNANVYPLTVGFTPEETEELNKLESAIWNYADSMIPKFIMGREELTEETFAAYQAQLESLGMPRVLEIRQAAYDRYVEKANK